MHGETLKFVNNFHFNPVKMTSVSHTLLNTIW